jgi:hypothetical protein
MIALALALTMLAELPTVPMATGRGRPSAVGLSTGFDDAVMPLTLSYATGLRVFHRPLNLGGALTTPLLRPGLSDLRGRVDAELDLHRRPGWMVRVALGGALTGSRNDAFYAVGVATRAGVTAGWSTRRFAIGGEVVGGLTLFTSIHTTAWARETGGLTFTRGTLWAPAWSLEAGLRAGVLLGRCELFLRAGFDRKGRYNLAIPSVYATLGVALRGGADGFRRPAARRARADRGRTRRGT